MKSLMKRLATPLSVVWFAGHRDLPLLLRSISSFSLCCQDSFLVNVVGDGSLKSEDRRAIEDAVRASSVSFPRIDVNLKRRVDIFKHRPNLDSHYNKSPLAKKSSIFPSSSMEPICISIRMFSFTDRLRELI